MPFPVETTCLDIFLRPLLQGIDRLIHVEQVSRDADDEECRQITETEDFAANQDGWSSVLVALPKTAV